MVFGSEALFAHARSFRQRFFALFALTVAELASFLFTFVFFFTYVNARVGETQNAHYTTSEFRKAQSQLQQLAASVRESEIRELEELDLSLKAQRKLLSSDAETRRRQAEQLARENQRLATQLRTSSPEDADAIRRRMERNQRLIRDCQADAATLRVRLAAIAEQEDQVRNRRQGAESFRPDFLSVKDNDWASLRERYETLALAHGRIQDTRHLQLPGAPAPPIYDADGRILRGRDDRFNEALSRVAGPWDAVVWWALILSAVVECPGFLALLATRPKGMDLPAKMFAAGHWMRRLRRAVESAEGVIPFIYNASVGFLFRKPVRPGHPAVHAYEELIEDLQMRMRDALREATAPAALATILETRLEALYANLIYRNYSLIAELDEEVAAAYDHCVSAIQSASLPHAQEKLLIRLLQTEADRLRGFYRAGNGKQDNPNEEKANGETEAHAQQGFRA
jgi:hypothetical protein